MNVLNQASVVWMRNGFFKQPWRFPPLARVTFGQKADEDGCGMAAVCVCVCVCVRRSGVHLWQNKKVPVSLPTPLH